MLQINLMWTMGNNQLMFINFRERLHDNDDMINLLDVILMFKF